MKYAPKTAAVPSDTCGTSKMVRSLPRAEVIPPVSAARCENNSTADTAQIANWKSDTAPTPTILPTISWKGRSEDTSTSTTCVVFSSRTELITFTPYSRMAMYSRMDMTYARVNDCAELSLVVEPEIFLVSRSTCRCAARTTCGSTPARSRRALTAILPSTPFSTPMSRREETLELRYSATPESTVASVTIRNPSSRRRLTSPVRESSNPARGAIRSRRVKAPLVLSESATFAPKADCVPSTTTSRLDLPPPENRIGKKIRAAKKIGPSSAEIQNHRVRTRSTNSRRTTASTLRMMRPSVRDRFRPDCFGTNQVDEDLVKRRRGELEPGQPSSRGDERPQHLLRIRSRTQLELRVLAEVLRPRD